VYPVTQNKNDRSALSLKRCLGVCCRTAWRLKHKLLEAMAERECGRVLTDVVVFIAAVEVSTATAIPGTCVSTCCPISKATRCARPCVRR
jgi:hypothetical protein